MWGGKWNYWWHCFAPSLNFMKGKGSGDDNPGCREREKTLQRELYLLTRLWDKHRHQRSTLICTPAACLSQPAGFQRPGDSHARSRLDALLPDVTWLIASKMFRLDACFDLQQGRWILSVRQAQTVHYLAVTTADSLSWPTSFIFLVVHSFDRDGCLSKAWRTNDDKSRTLNILKTDKDSLDFRLRAFIYWLTGNI